MNIGGKTFNPGDLRTPITLLQPVESANAGGFKTPTYTAATNGAVMADWKNAHGAEAWAAAAIQATRAATVRIRYRADLGLTWRVQKGSEVFEIVSIDNIGERSEILELKVRAVVGG